MTSRIIAFGLWVLTGLSGSAIEGTILDFPANGSLEARNGSGAAIQVNVAGCKPEQLTYIDKHPDKGVYLPAGSTLTIPMDQMNPQEGTISFWYRPDWAVGDCTSHTIVAMKAEPAFKLYFRKGATDAIAPDHCYLEMLPVGWFGFHPENLFTAREWRHYTIRWSAQRAQSQVLVDGYIMPQKGKFKTEVKAPVTASLILGNNACGAFAQLKVFNRWLETDELMQVAGLKQAAAYLQEQLPPSGGMKGQSGQAVSSYIDPATGKLVEVPAGTGTNLAGVASYNPARMPILPKTEHTAWARPLAGGPVRALMIMPTGFYNLQSMLREGVELWQRLDMDCEIVDQPDPVIMSREYDVIIVVALNGFSSGSWKGLNPELRAWVIDRVSQGKSGLVMTYPLQLDDAINGLLSAKRKISSEAVLRGFPASAMQRVKELQYDKVYDLDDAFFEDTADLSQNIVECYQDDKIRAVKLNYVSGPWLANMTMGLTPDTVMNTAVTDVHYDYWQALMARSVLFAAGRTNAVGIASVDISADKWKVMLTGGPSSGGLWYRGRDIWGRVLAEGKMNVKSPGTLTIEGVYLPPRAVMDVIVKDDGGKVLDWYSTAMAPADETRITGIVLDKTWYAKGEGVKGTVNIRSVSNGGGTLRVFLGDHEGRSIVRNEQSITLVNGSNSLPFSLVIPESSDSLLMRVDVQLLRDMRIVDSRSADCPVPQISNEGFYAGMSCSGSLNRFTNRQTRKLFRDRFNVNFLERGGGNYTYAVLPRENFRTYEYATHLGYPGARSDTNYDMTSPEHWENFFPKNLRTDISKLVPFHPLFYSLGEEHFVLYRAFRSPTCTPRFQDFVKKTYGSLEKLNAVWGTNYVAWNEVQMLTPEVVDMEKISFNTVDFINRRFMEHLFAERHAYLAQYFRKIDPQAEVGIPCGWDLWMGRGYDYWLLSKGMESMMGYDIDQGGVQNQYIRSFFKNHYGCCYHYRIGGHENVRWSPWYMLISGARGFMWYTAVPEIWGATTADLHLSSDWLASCDEFVAVKLAGDLLARTQYLQDQVAIHYSQDSFQAGVVDLTWIHNSFVNLCYDNGVPFRFVSYEQMADGELIKRKYPLVVLPHSISLSDKEVQALRVYLASGGVVWADVVPGEYNQFGQKLAESQVKDWFAGMEDTTLPGGKTVKRKKVGQGEVILADIGNYNYDRNIGHDLPTRAILDVVMGRAGIREVAQVRRIEDGKPANGVWRSGYWSGGQRYVVMGKDYQIVDHTTSDVKVVFPEKAHVYEMRSGKYYGYTDEVRTRLEPTRGKVFSLLPYRVKDIKVVSPARTTQGTDLVLKTKLLTNGNIGEQDIHLIRIMVTDPNGKETTALRRLAPLFGGKGEIRLPIAYNDPAGKWTVHLKDTATGMKKEVSFSLQSTDARQFLPVQEKILNYIERLKKRIGDWCL